VARVYERVGFVLEGTLRRDVFREGRYLDTLRMAILVDEWRAASGAAASGTDA
jgi:RimJ/RimL family protein N-acetyltransferase